MVDGSVLQIGCAAGFSNDRTDAGIELVKTFRSSGRPAVLFYETLGERTLALAQLARRQDPSRGYEPQLEEYLRDVLGPCLEQGVPIIGNFGAANPRAAAERIASLARKQKLSGLKIAVVEGDDLLEAYSPREIMKWRHDGPPEMDAEKMVSANAYLGAEPIARALSQKANVVVTGRTADPALALGPLIQHFGWDGENWDKLAVGTLAGHLLECGAQVTGGYFADPGFKDVPDPAWIGFPIAEVDFNGDLVITKASHTGGLVSRATVIEQIIYEIHDPSAYLTPDVVLNITGVTVEEAGRDRVRVKGARGKERPPFLKATLGFDDGWMAEGEISYAGPNALARARLALAILKERIEARHPGCQVRGDVIGALSLFNDDSGRALAEREGDCLDVRARVAARSSTRDVAETVRKEVAALYCCGPAGGGGIRTFVVPKIATASTLIPRERVKPKVSWIEVRDGSS
jgi:hypothetical protein